MSITIWKNLSNRAEKMQAEAFTGVKTLEDWENQRPEIYRQFMHSLGLEPLPERCDLNIRDYGMFKGDGFEARKIAFQFFPDCWSSASIYYPDPSPKGPAPGVLYVCGHARVGKHHYQAHPILWARRGYVCLIVDTIEQNDNPGEHHSGHKALTEKWLALGYSSSGGETWNTMRALDVLAGDPNVDEERLAVTGVSGGGSLSFHIAMADERIKAVSTLCGISTPVDAIANRHVSHNCDCFYPHNLYQRDTSEYGALIAPRAAMFCFADHDGLFHAEQTTALTERIRYIYQLYGQEQNCELVTCPGYHGNHPEFDEATNRWFDGHVAGKQMPDAERGEKEFPETVTSVFQGCPPQPNRVDQLPELLSPRATPPLPLTADEWPGVRKNALHKLKKETNLKPLDDRDVMKLQLDGDWSFERPPFNRCYRGKIEGVDVCMQTLVPKDSNKKVVMGTANDDEALQHLLARMRCAMEGGNAACAGFEPRLAGYTSPAKGTVPQPPGSWPMSMGNYYRRMMAIAGLTPVMMTIQDIGVAVDSLVELEETADCEVYLYGRGDAGVAALYHSLFDERVSGVILEDIPASHLEGAPIIGVLRALDIYHALGLMAPRSVRVVTPGHIPLMWPDRVYERLGCPERFEMTANLRYAFETVGLLS